MKLTERFGEMFDRALRFEREIVSVETTRKKGKVSHEVRLYHPDQEAFILSIPEIQKAKSENLKFFGNPSEDVEREMVIRSYEHRRWYLFGMRISTSVNPRRPYVHRTMKRKKQQEPEECDYSF